MRRANSAFWYQNANGGDVWVPKDKVVDDDHPDVKGHEMYFDAFAPESAPEPAKRRVRVRG